MGTGRSGPGVWASRFLIRRRASWKNLFWRAARFFRIVALTRKPPCFGIVRTCSHLHYSRNLRSFRVFPRNPARRAIYHAWFRTNDTGNGRKPSHPPRPPSTPRHDHLGFSTSARNCRVSDFATDKPTPAPSTGHADGRASTIQPPLPLCSLRVGTASKRAKGRPRLDQRTASKRAKVIGGFARFARSLATLRG
jgi:hypothetical protein